MKNITSKNLLNKWFIVLLLLVFSFACKKTDEPVGIVVLCPTVVSTDPMDDAVDVVHNKVITVTFNEAMNPESINNTTLLLKQVSTSTYVSGTILPTDNAAVYTFTPDVPLLPFNEYIGTVTKAATNTYRTTMVADYVFSFTSIPQLSLTALPLIGGITSGAGLFAQGSNVTVSAVPNTGYSFTNWTDSGTVNVISKSPNYQYTMSGNRTLAANFKLIPPGNFAINISSKPVTGGTTTGAGSYVVGSKVTTTATPNAGYSFANWTENGTIKSLVPFYQITSLTANRNLVANFSTVALSQLSLTLSSNPSLGGSTIGGGTYVVGTSVTVVATPKTGYTFVNWIDISTDLVQSTSNSYTFVLNNSKSLEANFKLNTYTITTTATNGTVVNSPSLVNYDYGSTVLLTATPNAGFTFTSWTGSVSDTTNPLTILMTSNKNIAANFTAIPPNTYSLNVTSVNGSVVKDPSLTSYTIGSNVKLTATPSTGYTFTSWTGDTTSTTNPLTISMNANKNITANYTAIPVVTYTLNVVSAHGDIEKAPNQTSYNSGTSVDLTATALTGYKFSSWSGDVVGTSNPIAVIMNANKNITANYTVVPPAVALGSIANFGAYGGNAGITNQGLHTMIYDGGIGTTAASTLVTGFHDGVSGSVYTETPLNVGNSTGGIFTAPPAPGTATSNTIATNALLDATTAYNSISPASKPGGTDPGAGELGGLTLAPGIYKSAGATFKITNLDLVLDAKGDPNAVWIFQTAAGLTVGTPAGARSIILIGGALAKNVYWHVGSTAVINYAGGGTMVGTILANSGVTLSSPGSSTTTTAQTILNGRAISLVSSVTMVNTIINNQ